MRRLVVCVALIWGVFCFGAAADVAQACPMCKAANESQNNALPRAYMYSILFMLSVPAMLVTGFSIGFYRLSKQREALTAESGASSEEHTNFVDESGEEDSPPEDA